MKQFKLIRKLIGINVLLITFCTSAIAQTTQYLAACYSNNNFVNTINTGLPVGVTEGVANVTATGAMSYVIPIVVPPGTNGLRPQISIVYNSQGGSGILGMGWSIGGLSSITRTGNNCFNDGMTSPINYTTNDKFSINGSRLELISGIYGNTGSVYGIESENFDRITANNYSNNVTNGPDWFSLVAKDGTIIEYGNSNDSKVIGTGGVLIWYVNKIIDKAGNYITFTYLNNYNDIRISEIDFTGNVNSGLPTYNKMSFNYSSRLDGNTLFLGSAALNTSDLLDEIIVSGENGMHFKTYKFKYGFDNVCSYLQQVFELGVNNTELNKTIFKYGENSLPNYQITNSNVNIQATYTTINNNPGTHTFSSYGGDFNGDGISDILISEEFVQPNLISFTAGFAIYSRDPNTGNYSQLYQSQPISLNNNLGTSIINPNQSFSPSILPADFNGDGLDDIITAELSNNAANLNGISINCSVYDITTNTYSFAFPSLYSPNIPQYNGVIYDIINSGKNYLFLGDFDGDGRMDYILNTGHFKMAPFPNIEWRTFVSFPAKNIWNQLVSSNSLLNQYAFSYLIKNADQINIIDFDGDGKSDFFINSGSNCYVYKIDFDNVSQTYTTNCSLYNSNWLTNKDKVYFGDFNGDNKTDIFVLEFGINLIPFSITYNPEIFYSTGSNFNSNTFTLNHSFQNVIECDYGNWFNNGHNSEPGDEILIGDYNGDGKSDILHYRKDIVDCQSMMLNTEFDVYYSKGIAFYEQTYYYPNNNQMSYLPNIRVLGDFDGDGKCDLAYKQLGDSYLHNIFFDAGSNEHVIEKIEDGFARQLQFKYYALTQNVHKRGAITPYPLNSIQSPIYVVREMMRPDFAGNLGVVAGINKTEYYYENARYHRGGRGFLGFENVHEYDISNNTESMTLLGIDPNYFIPYTSEVDVYELGNWQNTHYSKIKYATNLSASGNNNGQFLIHTDAITENDFITGSITNTYNNYDLSTGNIIQSVTNINGIENMVTNNSSFISVGSSTIPSLPGEVSITKTRIGQTPVTTKHKYTYSNSQLLEDDLIDPANPTVFQLSLLYQYDNFGNNIQTKEIGYIGQQLTRITSRIFDSKGRFPIATTNALHQTETKIFDPLWGKPESITDLDQLTTKFHYDEWGNLIQTDLPFGYSILVSYNWDINTNNNSVNWYTYTQYPGHPDAKIWYNSMGKEIMTKKNGLNDWITTTKNYDAIGNLIKETSPYLPWEIPMVTSYNYNNLYRYLLNSSTDFRGAKTYNYIYSTSQGTTTVKVTEAAGQVTSKTIDASGKLISSTDNGGKLIFEYDSRGNQTSVRFDNINTSNLIGNIYDLSGKLIKCFKMDRGYSSYTYDAFNRLVSETDANNNTHSYTYDDMDKILTRTGSEGVTTYSYWNLPASSNLNGAMNKIKSITDFNGGVTSYKYDTLSNLNYIYKNQPSQSSQSFTYDQFGRLIYKENHLSYSPQNLIFGLNYIYDIHGYLLNVSNQTNTLNFYSTIDENGLGQPTSYYLGNGVQFQISYNNGLPVNYYAINQNPINPACVQNLSLQWDYTSLNLLQRSDNLMHTSENFTYDNLNRLTKSQSFYTSNSPLPVSIANVALQIDYDHYSNNNSMGNIIWKNDAASTFAMNVTGFDHQTRQAINSASSISTNQQDITYNGFSKPTVIKENGYEIDFIYGWDYQREISKIYSNGNLQRTTEYYSDWDKLITAGGSSYINYVQGGDGLCAIVVIDANGTHTYYTHKDHLGSIITLTDENGNVIGVQNFDAYGRIRNPTTWSYNGGLGINSINIPPMPTWLTRGFTGEEHLPEFSLINLNARLYDPVLGRMLGPDKYVPDPTFTQDYNAYSYARNNPLSYTDKTGNLIFTAIGIMMAPICPMCLVAGIAADMGGIMNLTSNLKKVHNIDDAVAYYISGAAGGMASTVNPLMGGVITASGNMLIDVSNGNLPDIQKYPIGFIMGIGGDVLDGIAISSSGKLIKGLVWDYRWTQSAKGSGVWEIVPKGFSIVQGKFQGVDLEVKGYKTIFSFTEAGTYSVYRGIEAASGNTRYIGITSRDVSVRWAEHLRDIGSGKELLDFESFKGATQLSKFDARILEQTYINEFGGVDGGQLLNKINSIDPKYWTMYGIKP